MEEDCYTIFNGRHDEHIATLCEKRKKKERKRKSYGLFKKKKKLFFSRAIEEWNSLPEVHGNLSSVESLLKTLER